MNLDFSSHPSPCDHGPPGHDFAKAKVSKFHLTRWKSLQDAMKTKLCSRATCNSYIQSYYVILTYIYAINMCAAPHIYIYIYNMNLFVHMHMNIHIHIYIYAYMHICKYIYIYTRNHYIYIDMYIPYRYINVVFE